MGEAAVAAFGGVDILVNNAALMVDVSYDNCETIALESWNRAFAVNLNGALLCARAVIPAMRARGGGRIVNQTSGGAFPAIGLYGISKLALVGLTTTLAKQFGKENITCNAIAPGNVKSDAGKLLVPDDSPFIKFLEATCATRPRGEPDELVGALLLLCSDAGSWITGQVIHIDGGWVMRP
jgi:NAD(P)-dependent dehydrogenase (short-subunit alcohol dehydrogenase family)